MHMSHIDTIIKKIEENQRIDSREALDLYRNADLLTLGSLANQKRFLLHPEKVVTYVVDRNINYTNICVSGCRFCAFYRSVERGYILSKRELAEKIQETIDLGGTQILLQGGMHPDLEIEFYVDMLTSIKERFDIHIHGFSPPEIDFIAKRSHLSVAKTISILKKAGLDSIPGGGAEILDDDVRQRVSPNKCLSKEWLAVMRQAHLQGMRSSATMMFGHLEQDFHIMAHLEKIRALQDETRGFTAFIPWTFQPGNTKITVKKKTSVEYLKVLAVSRIFLDNIDNVQASWVTQGDKIGQTALFFGANDMGSTMIEENVVASAGVNFMLPEPELKRLITTAGFEPRQRDCYYNFL
jgi:cyclic dehypoxanthinyl futalosine synthase